MLFIDVLLQKAFLGVGLGAEGTFYLHIPMDGVDVTVQGAPLRELAVADLAGVFLVVKESVEGADAVDGSVRPIVRKGVRRGFSGRELAARTTGWCLVAAVKEIERGCFIRGEESASAGSSSSTVRGGDTAGSEKLSYEGVVLLEVEKWYPFLRTKN